MNRRDAPGTAEGWYALHDYRAIDWDAWRAADEGDRERALETGIEYLQEAVAVADATDGSSAVFAVAGHKADLLILHLRPTIAALDRLERQLELTAFAGFTDRPTSYLSVTEVSGYVDENIDEGIEAIDDDGLRNYARSRLYPTIPEAEHVCFYPMDKRRGPEHNWYDLPFEERAELMSGHGDIGREYAGSVTQIITGSIGLDDHEWGVTLFADDLTDVKHLLSEMRFDPSSSRYAEFGSFYIGRRVSPDDLDALLAGEAIPADRPGPGERPDHAASSPATGDGSHASPHDGRTGPATGSEATGDHPHGSDATGLADSLAEFGLDPADWAGEHAVVTYSAADPEAVRTDVADLRESFDHYDRHVQTEVASDGERTAVVSVWRAAEAAETAAGFLADLPDVTDQVQGSVGTATDGVTEGDDGTAVREALADLDVYAGQPHGEDVHAVVVYSAADPDRLLGAVDDLRDDFDRSADHVRTTVYEPRKGGQSAVVSIWDTQDGAATAAASLDTVPGIVARAGQEEGFATMGMFYTVEPEHRDEFLETFDTIGDLLADMAGHRASNLLVNHEDENDMFIASRWRAREDAMAFFRSETFAETVAWGRDILADRPRHVFLA